MFSKINFPAKNIKTFLNGRTLFKSRVMYAHLYRVHDFVHYRLCLETCNTGEKNDIKYTNNPIFISLRDGDGIMSTKTRIDLTTIVYVCLKFKRERNDTILPSGPLLVCSIRLCIAFSFRRRFV